MKAEIKASSMLTAFPDGTRVLQGEIRVDCEACGEGVILIPGHHMKAIRNILIEWCDEHPELTGRDEAIKKTGQTRFGGTAPADPNRN